VPTLNVWSLTWGQPLSRKPQWTLTRALRLNIALRISIVSQFSESQPRRFRVLRF